MTTSSTDSESNTSELNTPELNTSELNTPERNTSEIHQMRCMYTFFLIVVLGAEATIAMIMAQWWCTPDEESYSPPLATGCWGWESAEDRNMPSPLARDIWRVVFGIVITVFGATCMAGLCVSGMNMIDSWCTLEERGEATSRRSQARQTEALSQVNNPHLSTFPPATASDEENQLNGVELTRGNEIVPQLPTSEL